MALSKNPNRTKSIEKAWLREIKRKFKQLNSYMLSLPLESEVKVSNNKIFRAIKTFIVNVKSIITGNPDREIFTNVTAAQQAQIDIFMTGMREEAIGILLSTPWQNKYQTEAYKRGIDRADSELKAALPAQEVANVGTLDTGATALINTAVHAAELDFLHERANVKLSKWVDDLLFDTRSILHEQLGIVSVDDIHAAITDRINVTTSRATTIEVTEIAQASQRSVIKEVEQVNSQSDELVEVRWISVADQRVRDLHAAWHGEVMSNEQASRNITISPWNCRCAVKAVVKNRTPARVDAKFKAERKLLLAKEKAAK